MAMSFSQKFSRMSGAPYYVAKWLMRFYLIMFAPLLTFIVGMWLDHPGASAIERVVIDSGPWALILVYSTVAIAGSFYVPRFARVAVFAEKNAKVPCEHCLYLIDKDQPTCPECGRRIDFATLVAKWKPWCDQYRKRVNLAKGP